MSSLMADLACEDRPGDGNTPHAPDGYARFMSTLFSPTRLREIVLRNRVMISPMCQYSADEDGRAGDWHLVHYGRFAQGGAGLVMVEATAIAPQGRLGYGDLGIWNDYHVAGLSRIAGFIEAEGAVPAIQLGHSGRKASTQRPWHGHGPLGPEDWKERGEAAWQAESVTDEPPGTRFMLPVELTLEKVHENLRLWEDAARRAAQAGFKALEIHGAHGYLIHSFLSPISNKRTDAYGGDFAGRTRFGIEVVESVRKAWPEHLPLFFRISALDAAVDGWSLEDTIALARVLKAKGVDLIDCSSGGIGSDPTIIPRGPGFQVPFAEKVRVGAGVKTVAVGLITDAEQAECIVADGRADLVAVGREALFNPNWPLHAMRSLEPDRRFDEWPPSSGWWLNRRKMTS
jgi:2,4-dienoyl-CoA reductase-like NADH-dependent reductase (Old Yellow Enzyme family)